MNRTLSRLLPIAIAAVAICLTTAPLPAHAGGKVKAVATVSIFGEILRHVGGDRVDVKVLQPPNRNVHFYEPRPSDILRLSRADVFVHGGLDLELWRPTLVEAARNRDVFPGGPGEVDCAKGIRLLEIPAGPISRAEGDVHIYGNPHYWLDPANLGIIATTVANGLARVDPAHTVDYERNRTAFQARLGGAVARWKAVLSAEEVRDLAAYHNAWPYFARAFDLRIETFLEPKPNIPPSGSHLKKVVAQVRERNIRAILFSPYQHRPYADQVASQTGAKVIVVSLLPGGVPGTEDLFEWMDSLTAAVAEVLGSEIGGTP
jgi:zinc/manganese transport system substrate-binding protein